MNANVILSKKSSEREIKAYFVALLQLSKSDDPFPADLEEVWPLVYERKDNAVKALRKDFIENVDYKLLRQKAEQVTGAKYVDDYKLSISCLEYFIARKV